MSSQVASSSTKRISARKRQQMKDLERHRRRCIVCHHPEREAIEEEFFHWRNVWEIGRQYQLVDYRTIYRHARATGLNLERRENLHSALDCIVEWSEDVRPTGDVILRAMRAYSCIDSHGRWTDPPKQVIISTFPGPRPTNPPAPSGSNPPSSAPGSQSSTSNSTSSEVIDLNPPELDEELEDEELEEEIEDQKSAAAGFVESNKFRRSASPGDVTACAVSPAQFFVDPTDHQSDETFGDADLDEEFDDDDADLAEAEEDAEFDEDEESDADLDEGIEAAEVLEEAEPEENAELEEAIADDKSEDKENVASQSDGPQPCASRLQPRHQPESRSDSTACAASPAQASVGASRADAVTDAEPDEAEDVAAFDNEELDGDLEDNPTSRSDQPLAQIHPRNSSQLSQPEKSGSRSDSTACAVSSAQPTPRNEVRGHNPQSRSVSDPSTCAASPAQPAPPNPERSPYYTELLITCAPKHSQAPPARPYPPTFPPEPRRATPAERRDADLRRALPHPPDPSQPLQPHHYLELLDRCLDPVAARKLRPDGRRTRKLRGR
jgi:hypothetical protein